MSLEADGTHAWRWIDVKVKSGSPSYCPPFRYQNRKWFLDCSKDWDGIIELHLSSYYISSESRHFSPFVLTLLVFRGRGAIKDYLHLTQRVNNASRQLLWQRKISEVEQIFPNFSQDHLLTFRIQFTEQNPQRGMISALDPAQSSTLANHCPQPQMHCKTFADASVQTSLTAGSISCLDALSADFGQMLDAESDSDLEIQCRGQTTRAHKNILCSRSPVFAKMLQSDMLEGNTGMLNIRDMDIDTFQKFLNYLYTGRLDDALTDEAAVSLYKAADMYVVESLRKRCSQFLVQNLTVENACNLLAIADTHGDEDFKRIITRYILEEKIPQSGERWQAFCKSHSLLATEVLNQYVDLYTVSEGPSKKRRV